MKKLAKVLMVAAPAFVLAACSSSSDNAAANANDNVAQFGGMSAEDLQHRYNTVYFDFDKYTIRAEDQKILDAHAELLKATNKNVTVAGHTDERGTPEYNIALGQRRANAVQNYLAQQGASNVATVSYGEEKPAVLGHTEADYAKNRRAELEY
ncbi:MAG: peptidoglycan-associated lipoprotein Pal [Haemophilus parahaemolyticus]|uniref:peptidoglycan-associated lipoprotein Pal n=1 Tax=Haemophilus parahaemolyticus TaxID=735 RepID=UPI0026EE4779|nr:peptidoglycan-associated lipoprotein Pal [Haemophilus parahaemolyticus]MBS6008702.1 peptidoglycan-associated lipoprotein Pal [Haemophilus parahaemolyticus]